MKLFNLQIVLNIKMFLRIQKVHRFSCISLFHFARSLFYTLTASVSFNGSRLVVNLTNLRYLYHPIHTKKVNLMFTLIKLKVYLRLW